MIQVEVKTLTRIDLMKFQVSKQLFSNPQPVHVTAKESLTVFYAFYFEK